jgi:Alginate export
MNGETKPEEAMIFMSNATRWRSLAWLAAVAIAIAAGGVEARAGLGDLPEPNLTLYSEGDNVLKSTIQVDSAVFSEGNAWFGESRANAGDHVGVWSEFGVVPGLEGALGLGDYGSARARVSGVWTTTQTGLDAAGSNLGDRYPHEMTLEDAYLGWSSGGLFPSLGKDAVDLSFGSQKYQVGSGFLFWDGATDGGSRGGYWLGMRKAFEMAGIAKLTTGPFKGEAVYLRPNDLHESHTNIFGTNLEWSLGERSKIGAGYWYFENSPDPRRDGLNVVDVRGEVHPYEYLPLHLPGLVLSAELVHEDNGDLNDSWGGYAEIGYDFDVWMKPYLSYRYSGYTGDTGSSGEIEAFDPLFYGMSDWASWYQGEIFGEFVATNRNLETHTVRLRVEPAEKWKVNLIGILFELDEFATELQPRIGDPRVVLIHDKDLASELDVVVDWEVGEHLLLSAVFGTLFPSNGVKQATGGSATWTHGMLYASIPF